MGQRLNLEIKIDNEVIGNVYFHWGAYTYNSLEFLERIGNVLEESDVIEELIEADTELAKQVWFVKVCEKAGFSGLKENSHTYLSGMFPDDTFIRATNRNEGLVSITVIDMSDTVSWQEGTCIVYIDSDTGEYSLSNDLIWLLGMEQDLFEYADVATEEAFEEHNGKISDIPTIDEFETIEFGDMNVNEVRTVMEQLNESIEGQYFKVDDRYYVHV